MGVAAACQRSVPIIGGTFLADWYTPLFVVLYHFGQRLLKDKTKSLSRLKSPLAAYYSYREFSVWMQHVATHRQGQAQAVLTRV